MTVVILDGISAAEEVEAEEGNVPAPAANIGLADATLCADFPNITSWATPLNCREIV